MTGGRRGRRAAVRRYAWRRMSLRAKLIMRQLKKGLASAALSKLQLHELLRRMLRIRLFDERASELMAAARLPGALHNSIGQEAEIVGACMALRDDDYMTGNHRSHGHPIGKGVALAPLMAELFGKQTGVCGGKGGSMHLAVFSAGSLGESGIVGSLMPIAVGAGLSARMRGTDQVCLCFFGDGAANCGPFHESLNLAAVWQLPVVFLCENNGYAIYSRQMQTTAVAHIAHRASAYDMPGAIVDGQDVLAVYDSVYDAVDHARAGNGPTLIEAKTYRYCEHSETAGARKPPVYRSEQELARWRGRDPIEIFCNRLASNGSLTPQEFMAMKSEVQAEVDAAVEYGERSPMPEPHALFEDVFAEGPEE
jgi:TPP-dependent pyruvate/acetoin dehydrogenase alpha subunit